MSSESKRLLKMSCYFGLFFIPFVWCAWQLVTKFPGAMVIDSPILGGRQEAHGFILVFTGLGAALFGREVFDAARDWRSMRRSRRPTQPRQRINWTETIVLCIAGLGLIYVVVLILIVFAAGWPLLLLFLVAAAYRWYPRRCRQCRRRRVREVASWKDDIPGKIKRDPDTGVLTWHAADDEQLARTSGVTSLYLCKHCGARFKQSGSEWTALTDEEWELFHSKTD
jgi:hypothetical protein